MKPIVRLWALIAMLCAGASAQAQIVTLSPAFPTMDDNLTITYDATQGNGALAAYADTVFGHFGLVTASPASTSWTHTQGTWGTSHAPVMTRISPAKYQISFVPRTFFGNLAANVVGYRIGMLFRNRLGTIAGRTETGGDIFADLYQPGQLSVRFTNPSQASLLLAPATSLPLLVESSASAGLAITDNGAPLISGTGTSLTYAYSTAQPGTHKIMATANFGTAVQKDSFQVVVVGAPKVEAVPAGMADGPNYLSPTSALLVLAAPGKSSVFVRGDFNNWAFDTAYYMRKTPDGTRFWVRIDNLTGGQEYVYQFTIDGSLTLGDPLCDKVSNNEDAGISPSVYPNPVRYPSDKATGIASVLRPGRTPYVFVNPRPSIARIKQTIYELHVRDFLGRSIDKTFKGLVDTLGYLQKLGVNTVELMPVNEFEGNSSWGYNPSYHGAVDKSYGPDEYLKILVDSCHGRGMAVILDVVYNHAFGSSPLVQMYPAASNPYFNAVPTHPYNVGYDFNHESPYTRAYIDRCNQRWLQDYNVDGFRFDLAKGFTQKNSGNDVGLWGQFDRSRVRNVARIGDVCRFYYPNAYLILEYFAENAEQKLLSDSLDFMLWGYNETGNFQSAIKALPSNSDLSGTNYKSYGWVKPNLVVFAESHDEERLAYAAKTEGRIATAYNIRDSAIYIARAKTMGCALLSVPGPKMIWQFGELAYDYSINTCPNGTINGGCRTDPKPSRWNYFSPGSDRSNVYKVYQAMLRLRATEPVFSARQVAATLGGNFGARRVLLRDTANNVDAIVQFNMDVVSSTHTGGFTRLGRWYEFWSGDSIQVDSLNRNITLQAGEVRIYSTKKFYTPTPNLITSLTGEVLPALRNGYRAAPNPTTGAISLDGPAGPLTCTVIGTDGRQIGSVALSGTERSFNLASLPGGKPAPGLYILQVAPITGQPARLRLLVQ